MFTDWIIQKTGMVLAFFVLLGIFYQANNFYDYYCARRETIIAVQEIVDQLATVANSAFEYSVDSAFSKKIYFSEEIHGYPYIFTLDDERQHARITLIGENISEFAMLPASIITNDAGQRCLVKEGFNSHGETSVGINLRGMNRARGILITKSRSGNYTTNISVLI